MANQLLDILHRQPAKQDQPSYAYIWQKHGANRFRTEWFEVGEPLPPYHPDVDTYFGVHPCKSIPTKNRQGQPAPPHHIRGKIEDVASIACLFAEFDLHTKADEQAPPPPAGLPAAVAAPGEDGEGKEALLAHVRSIDPAPSCIVDSGGGYHAYWFLDHAVPATPAVQRAQAAHTNRLASHPTFPADPASKDLARVLRLPSWRSQDGTEHSSLNHKYDPPRPVTIVSLEPDRTYPLATLTAAASAGPTFTVTFTPEGPRGLGEPEIVTVADIKTYVTHAVSREFTRVRRSTEGTRNTNLNQAAFAIGRYIDAADLDIEYLAQQLLNAALQVGLDRSEAVTTLARALAAGQEDPVIFRVPEDVIEDFATATSVPERIALRKELTTMLAPADATVKEAYLDAAKQAGMGGKTSLAKSISQSRATDADVRDQFLDAHPNISYHPALEWMTYQAGYYTEVPEATVKRLVASTINDADRSTLTAARVDSITKLVYWEVCRPIDAWDQADLVVCSNGTLDLSPGQPIKLRPHRRDDWSTHNVSYDYPSTPLTQLSQSCPNFLKVTSRLPPGLAAFLQEYVGYCLTSDTRHDIMIWLVGRPGSGKSTLVRGILTALGNHATMLSLRELNRSRFALNAISGKTLIYGTDVGTDFADNTEALNTLVSGDPIRVEAKYSNPVEMRPTAKVLWAMTRMPQLRDPDDGLFRRVQVIHIPPLPPQDADPDLRLAVEQEGPGILQWAIAGLKRLRARGRFDVPSAVRDWTIRYRDDQDKTGHFVHDCLSPYLDKDGNPAPYISPVTLTAIGLAPGEELHLLGPESLGAGPEAKDLARASDAYRAYREWCKINGYNPLGKYKMYDDLRRLGVGVEAIHSQQRLTTHGLRPKSDWDPEHKTFTITTGDGSTTITGGL